MPFLLAAPLPPPVSRDSLWLPLTESLLFTHLLTLLGFLLALLIVGKMLAEKRTPSNIFAWALLVLFIPYLGVPLFFLLGGRKSKRLVENKRRIQELAAEVCPEVATSPPRATASGLGLQRRFEGNTVTLLPNGQAVYEAFLREIDATQRTLHIVTYILGNDRVSRTLISHLAARARAGVEVKLLVDALGSFTTSRRTLRPLLDAGGRVARFMPVWPLQTKSSANLRNHRKFALFDSRLAIVGGQNMDRRFMDKTDHPGLFHDFSAAISGPILTTFNRIFAADWCFATGDSPETFRALLSERPAPCGDAELETIPSGPDLEDDPLWERLLTLVQEARKDITIVTPYFIPDEVLFTSLIIKAHAGYRVRLILPHHSNHRIADFARGHYLHRLHEAGAEILLYTPRMLHAKLLIVDHEIAMIGSANIDNRSLFVNFEIGLFASSHQTVQKLESWVDDILPHCIPYAQTRPAQAGRLRRIGENMAHLVAPML